MSNANESINIVFVDRELEPLIPDFIENRKKNFSEIETALKKSDWQKILRVAHILKGVCGGFGFDKLSLMSVQIEELSTKRNTMEIQHLMEKMRAYLDNVQISWK